MRGVPLKPPVGWLFLGVRLRATHSLHRIHRFKPNGVDPRPRRGQRQRAVHHGFLRRRKAARTGGTHGLVGTWEISGGTWEISGGTWEISGGTWEISGGTWEMSGGTWEMSGGTWEMSGGHWWYLADFVGLGRLRFVFAPWGFGNRNLGPFK